MPVVANIGVSHPIGSMMFVWDGIGEGGCLGCFICWGWKGVFGIGGPC